MVVGEIFLTAFIQVVFEKLASPELIKFARREGVHTTIKKWKTMLETITEVLDDAEEKQVTNQVVKSWLDDLRDLAYDVDDILDEFATEALHGNLAAEREASTSKVRSLIPMCCTSFNPSSFAFKYKIRSKIEEINGRLEVICEQRAKLGFGRVAGETSTKVWQKPTSTSLVNEPSIYGRDEDKEKIINLLLKDDSNGDKFGVIPIVGMGGVGKTTLAQTVYNDEMVKKHFAMKAWVCVSDEYDVMRITKSILESVTSHSCDFQDLNQIQVKLKETLAGKRFFLVLDDMWNKKYSDWEFLQNPFREGLHGSKIMVTTRDRDVASMMGTVEYHYLEQLSETSCWLVFEQHAFGNRSIDSNPNLVAIGKKIVKKCKGLPLAATTLGGLLRSKVEEREWEHILNSNIWELSDAESDILPALRLSYHHLPSDLKRCFSYCAILPEDYEFSEREMVLLWMAEGFLQQEGEKHMEDLGRDYFYDLVSRSFFQSSRSNNSLFVMHDLINELAQWAAGGICFRLEDKLESNKHKKISKKGRHSSYIHGNCDGVKKFKAFYEVKCLRTFLPLVLAKYNFCYITRSVPIDLLPKLRCLRVLSLSRYAIIELPDSIGDLKHLRYLDLSHTLIKSLPESTSTLYNLQTLILTHCYKLKKLPTRMRNLINLRHLDITGLHSIEELLPQIGMLTSLRTLSNFVVGKGNEFGIRQLGNLLHLQGALSLSRLENVLDAREAWEANLKDKLGLDVLEIKWSRDLNNNSRVASIETDVLDMLQPQKRLKELTIKCYGGTRFPTWIGHHSFCNMVLVRLEDCVKCTALPPLGQLSMLKDLCIRRMNGVKSVGSEFYGVGCPKPFPSLETLSFEDMQEWEDWLPCGVDEQVELFLCLHKLSISRCPKLLGKLPNQLTSLEKLVINGCQQLVVSISSLPKLCELDIKDCQEVVQSNTVVDLSSLKSMVVSNVSNLMCLTEAYVQSLTTVEDLEIKVCNDLTSLWQKEGGLLQYLTSLRRLRIEGCPNFVSLAREEAEQQQQEQQLGVGCKLESLELCSCDNLEKLRGFKSFTSLKKLTVKECPSLVSFLETDLPSSLKELEIVNCGALKSLHPVMMQCGQYASLEYLYIATCDSLTSIAKRQLPSTLKRLEIHNCKNLKCLVDEEEGSVTTPTISSSLRDNSVSLLEDLEIWNCESLTSLSSTGELPATLKYLSISDCPKLESVVEMLRNNTSLEQISLYNYENLESLPEGLHNFTNLSSINIWKCPSLVSFPDGGLPTAHLTSLSIEDCEKLEALPDRIHNLTSLQTLRIWRCSGLVSFPEEGFPSNLTDLNIGDLKICKPLFQWGLHRLTSLRTLEVAGGCPDVVSFPEEEEGMTLPTSLTELSIGNFPNLEKLSSKGFQNLSSLESLTIYRCPKLKSFPKEGLPPSLMELHIRVCPQLKQRCKKDQGQDWPKISHIPCVQIDGRFIFDPGE